MKTKKPLIVRIVIWVCVIAMVISLIWVYVVYMFAPTENAVEESINENQQEDIVSNDTENSEENIELEINDENTENVENTDNEEFNLVTEDWEVEEMDETIEVQLENGETELVRLGDLSDAIQID